MNILETKEYNIFKIFKGNRPLDKFNLKKLTGAMTVENLLPQVPILVNGKMEIIDGQHRFMAAKSLNLPISYILKEDANYQDIISLNEHKRNWKGEDYLRLYGEGLNRESYLMLESFMKENHLKLSVALMIVNGPVKQMDEYQRFRSGSFQWPISRDEAQAMCDKLTWIWNLLAEHGVKPLHRFKNSAFVKPFMIFVETPKMIWEVFQEKATTNWFKLGTRPSLNLYLEMLIDIYNFRTQNKIFI